MEREHCRLTPPVGGGQKEITTKKELFLQLHTTSTPPTPETILHRYRPIKMFSRAAIRSSQAVAGRRAFHATPARLSSPYHYPEGPYSNLPFNPRKKSFGLLYWGAMTVGFFAPFGISAEISGSLKRLGL
ncbi:oxidoreductase [Grosmannia clavigera kw1407]|uniref:Oxidoreductase n=1 Tax=Grosmannia clavigera (strain kw1407 / UAMH 11150) TaxID=655863 RepID=F0X6U8_GROCL|nr:oxidoreductase [Grosmannia clavigera kw1407]EFX06409.1 oxidoreductase [Grosmannia clavigera kw1407]